MSSRLALVAMSSPWVIPSASRYSASSRLRTGLLLPYSGLRRPRRSRGIRGRLHQPAPCRLRGERARGRRHDVYADLGIRAAQRSHSLEWAARLTVGMPSACDAISALRPSRPISDRPARRQKSPFAGLSARGRHRRFTTTSASRWLARPNYRISTNSRQSARIGAPPFSGECGIRRPRPTSNRSDTGLVSCEDRGHHEDTGVDATRTLCAQGHMVKLALRRREAACSVTRVRRFPERTNMPAPATSTRSRPSTSCCARSTPSTLTRSSQCSPTIRRASTSSPAAGAAAATGCGVLRHAEGVP